MWDVVNSKRGIAFRRWANSVLKKYVIQGYAINEKRLQALEKTVDIQTKMLASTLEVEESDILKAVTSYTDALMLLDQYDHQSLKKPVGNRPIYKITYEECKKMVSWEFHLNRTYSVWRKKMVKLRVFWLALNLVIRLSFRTFYDLDQVFIQLDRPVPWIDDDSCDFRYGQSGCKQFIDICQEGGFYASAAF